MLLIRNVWLCMKGNTRRSSIIKRELEPLNLSTAEEDLFLLLTGSGLRQRNSGTAGWGRQPSPRAVDSLETQRGYVRRERHPEDQTPTVSA